MAMIDRGAVAAVCAMLSAFGFIVACSSHVGGSCDSGVTAPLIQCPGLFTLLVAPDQVEVGSAAAVTATAMAPMGTEAGATVLSWRAPSGSFSDPNASLTTFTCSAPGTVTLTLTVTRGGCAETLTASVNCVSSRDGGNEGGD